MRIHTDPNAPFLKNLDILIDGLAQAHVNGQFSDDGEIFLDDALLQFLQLFRQHLKDRKSSAWADTF